MKMRRNVWMVTNFLFTFVFSSLTAQNKDMSDLIDLDIKPDIVYGHKYGMALTMDIYQPKNHNGAAVIFMNSGGFVSGQVRQYEIIEGKYRFVGADELLLLPFKFHYPPLEQFSYKELLSNGFTIFDICHGSSPKFTLDEMVEDLSRGVRFVKFHADKYNIDPNRIGLSGASAGGYLAIFLAVSADQDSTRKAASTIQESGDEIDKMDTKVQAVATWYPAGYDFLLLKEGSKEAYENLSALHVDDRILDSLSIKHYISPNDPPVYIIYGDEDFPFITEACKAIHHDYRKHNIESKLNEISGTGHEFRGKNNEYHAQHGKMAMSEIVAWFKRHLIQN